MYVRFDRAAEGVYLSFEDFSAIVVLVFNCEPLTVRATGAGAVRGEGAVARKGVNTYRRLLYSGHLELCELSAEAAQLRLRCFQPLCSVVVFIRHSGLFRCNYLADPCSGFWI